MHAPAKLMQHSHEAPKTIVSMDTMGIIASTACLIHCAAMPFLITMLPFIGLEFLKGHTAHYLLAAFVVIFAFLAIVPGYMRHKHSSILILMLTGVAIVLFATFGADRLFPESFELPMITAGNLLVVLTHLRNRGLCKC